MLTDFLGWFKALPIVTKAAIGFVIVGLLAVAAIAAKHFIDRAFSTAETIGETRAEAKAAGRALENVETGNAAAENIARNPAARHSDCLHDSRTPANC